MGKVDKYGLWNVKECPNGDPSGNDGPIVTAYAEKVGLPVDRELIKLYFQHLKRSETWINNDLPIERLPGKAHPYPSRDTILGWYWLKLIDVHQLQKQGWKFSPVAIPKFHFIKTICQLILCFYEHRNYFWQKEFYQVYRFAFSVPVQDRAYMLKASGLKVPFWYSVYTFFSDMLEPSSVSSKLIAWRKGKLTLEASDFVYYFGSDHEITKAAISEKKLN